jgi:hypothetical protein
VLLARQQREVVRVDELIEHVSLDPLRQPVFVLGDLGGVDHRAARQPRQPVLALLLKKRAERPDPGRFRAGGERAGPDREHVVLQQQAGERGRGAEPGCAFLKPAAERP